jgi:hypothetical protein
MWAQPLVIALLSVAGVSVLVNLIFLVLMLARG